MKLIITLWVITALSIYVPLWAWGLGYFNPSEELFTALFATDASLFAVSLIVAIVRIDS